MTVKVCVPDVPPDVVIETLRVPFAAPDTIENVTVNEVEPPTTTLDVDTAPSPKPSITLPA